MRKKRKKIAATVTVEWGYELHTLELTPRNWARVQAGKPFSTSGNGSHYEGEFFSDYWHFNDQGKGSLTVTYGDEGTEGWIGNVGSAMGDVANRPQGRSKRR